jgi:membrane dipeptidase
MADAFVKVAAIRRMTDRDHAGRIGLALTAADVRRIHDGGRVVALMGMENGFALGPDLDLLDTYYALGVRYLGLLHNGHNDIGDSAVPGRRRQEPPSEHGGLSDFGRAVIARANDLGMMVDVSHAAMTTTLDAIRASRAPVIASHSAVRGVHDHPRNLSDEALLALGKNGGVVSIVAFDAYLRAVPEGKRKAIAALRAEWDLQDSMDWARLTPAERDDYAAHRAEMERQWPRASVSDLVDHIDYAVGLIGIDHVGITSDFNGGGGVEGWDNANETPNVTLELVRRGYSEAEIAKLWGGNLLRVMVTAEALAAGSKDR